MIKFFRCESLNGEVGYFTIDNKYCIRKYYNKADWEVCRLKDFKSYPIKYFKYFKDAKNFVNAFYKLEG